LAQAIFAPRFEPAVCGKAWLIAPVGYRTMAVRYSPYPGKGPSPAKGFGFKGMADAGKGSFKGMAGGTVRLDNKGMIGQKGPPPGMMAGGKGVFTGKAGASSCRYFAEGTCTKGAMCAFPHVVPFGKPAAAMGAPISAGLGGSFKSKICKYFELGTCTSGAGCRYAHGVHELSAGGPAPQAIMGYGLPGPGGAYKTKTCKYFEMGTCTNGQGCSYIHGPPGKGAGPGSAVPGAMTRMCKFWESGTCPQGRACTFAHSEAELRSNQGKGGKDKGKRNPKTMLCANHETEGGCPRSSEECMFAHGVEELVEYVASDREMQFQKTKLCKFFEQGSCSRGEECLYAHGGEELQPFEFEVEQPTVYNQGPADA